MDGQSPPVCSTSVVSNMGMFTSKLGPASLLQYPLEIRLQIYEYVLTQPILFKHPYSGHPHGGTSLALLEVNRQIYHEARLLPFKLNKFCFQRWYGSSIFCCKSFLKSLQDWQISSIQRMEITVTERDLGDWQSTEGWLKICQAIGPSGGKQPGLRSLTLMVDEIQGCDGETVFDGHQAWAEDLRKFTTLRTLRILVRNKEIRIETLGAFEMELRQAFASVEIDVQKVVEDT